MISISFFNQKGGVGKTTSSVLLVDYLIKQGKKVLAIDLDPQASFTMTFARDYNTTVLDYFSKYKLLEDCIFNVNDQLDLLASHINLMSLPQIDSAYLDIEKLNFSPILSRYDYVIIDSRPSLDWFSRLAIKLANYVLMPIYLDRYSFEALDKALEEINLMKTSDLKGAWIFENRSRNQKTNLDNEFYPRFKERLGDAFIKPFLLDGVAIKERTAQNINFFDYKNPNISNVSNFCSSILEMMHV